MSRLYLQKGGIDHFIDKGVQLDNKSYTPMSIDGGGGGADLFLLKYMSI